MSALASRGSLEAPVGRSASPDRPEPGCPLCLAGLILMKTGLESKASVIVQRLPPASVVVAARRPADAQTALATEVTCRAWLRRAGGPVHGTADLSSRMFPPSSSGTQLRTAPVKSIVAVAHGPLNVALGLGGSLVAGDAGWPNPRIERHVSVAFFTWRVGCDCSMTGRVRIRSGRAGRMHSSAFEESRSPLVAAGDGVLARSNGSGRGPWWPSPAEKSRNRFASSSLSTGRPSLSLSNPRVSAWVDRGRRTPLPKWCNPRSRSA